MPIGLLHQVGHNSNWNVSSFEEDGCGDGLILSPLHQAKNKVEELSRATREVSLFDPQFYLPSSRKQKLLSYPFFPEGVDGGFQTSTFVSHASMVAKACIDFQVEQGFRAVVVPTRFLNQMYPDYFERQGRFTVDAFIEQAQGKPLCLSVAVTSHMILDPTWRNMLLNWITSFPNVEEMYLMYQHERDLKQIQDPEFLREGIRFFKDVLATGLRLTVGYTNTEGLLLTAAGDLDITMGAFENTRIFSVDKFLESEGDRRGPKARIYLPGLLNWVQFEDAKSIRARAPEVWREIYRPTDWSEEALERPLEPTFNQPPLYKHYFSNTHDIVQELNEFNLRDRRAYLLRRVEIGLWAYRELSSKGVQLERHGQGGHLPAWRSVLQAL
ncbi:hypothetical protein AVTE2539_09915 [Acidovorax sp. SUPP2539]|nr:hypothetical protein AVTE2539_09915 [Acidovorax sp. SUPP2539]